MKIQSLLNPFCGTRPDYHSPGSPTSEPMPHPVMSNASMTRRQKIPKDAPIFSEGNKTVGFVNYPPHEASDDERIATQHREFQLFPSGEIRRKGVRHIPYNSDKKDFLEKTGRDAFEMFQYTYRIPGDDKEYVVVWDYNVGLVRMTPFFKSLKFSKTIPAKALRENAGLKDISYSITGGALVCQGYWMPYQAAKAIAATFCFNIRWALTPIFGNDFPSLCIHPDDSNYARFLIDPEIVHECIEETNRFRVEGQSYRVVLPQQLSNIHTPRLQFGNPPWGHKDDNPRYPRISEDESGYCTESDYSDKYLFSPQISPRSTTWTSVNRSQSPASPLIFYSPTSSTSSRFLPSVQQVLPTSVPDGYYDEPLRTKRAHSKAAYRDNDDDDDGYEEASRPHTSADSADSMSDPGIHDCGNGTHTQKELDAANIILELSAADKVLPPTKRTRRTLKY